MTALLWVPGLLCVAAVVIDVLWTTVAAGAGGGPLTGTVGNRLWAALPRSGSGRDHRILAVAGVVITVFIFAVWMLLLLLGWTLVFSAAPDAVVHATTGQPADMWSRVYFTGYTVLTLGIGDYVPGAPPWQMAAVAATFSGLALMTLAITYLLSVTSSVTQRRQFAGQVSAMGSSPVEILRRAWDGRQLHGLEDQLRSLSASVGDLTQRHLAYPVLHYFHSFQRENAVAPFTAVLDELLMTLEHGIVPEHRLPRLTTSQLRDTIGELLRLLEQVLRDMPGSPSPPAVPDLGPLRDLGLPVVSDAEWHAAAAQREGRRRLLAGYVRYDGWQWDTVWQGESAT